MDRNLFPLVKTFIHIKSLSARRAWIEIISCEKGNKFKSVALRKESVDRNFACIVNHF